ncbi:MAG: hypothetical protein HFJ43_03765 [Clostridia bacterium]|nr:hypothetical protein [Clostridia bacterium]
MNTKYKKYKVYLILLGIFAIISFILGYLMYQSKVSEKEWFDEIYEVVINGEEKEQNDIVDKFNKSIKEKDKKYTKESIKQKLDETKKGEIYVLLENGKDADVISVLSMQYLSMFNGYMMIVAFLIFVEKKFLKSLNNVLRIILNIIAVTMLIPFSYYVIMLGIFGLPIAVIYCLYKYFKTRKLLDTKNQDECVDVLGKVDANKIFSNEENKDINNIKKEISNNDSKND